MTDYRTMQSDQNSSPSPQILPAQTIHTTSREVSNPFAMDDLNMPSMKQSQDKIYIDNTDRDLEEEKQEDVPTVLQVEDHISDPATLNFLNRYLENAGTCISIEDFCDSV